MGSQRVGHDLVTEQQQRVMYFILLDSHFSSMIVVLQSYVIIQGVTQNI